MVAVTVGREAALHVVRSRPGRGPPRCRGGYGAVELVALADLARDGQANQVTRPSRGLEREEESGIEPLT
jgi:hypothetical protein